MSNATPPTTGQLVSQPYFSEGSRSAKIALAILIITTLGTLCAAGSGLTGFGTHLGWWNGGSLSHLSLPTSITLLCTGLTGAATSLALLILLRRPSATPSFP